ncbi:hypothetical protein L204_105277 [Cryptococcus depauperatus]
MTASTDYFENLYFTNGTFIVLTNDSLHMLLQGASYILSTLADLNDWYRKHGTVQEDRFMVATPHEAIEKGLVRPAAVRKAGIIVFFNDARQGERSSLDHYFRSSQGEMLLDCWRFDNAVGESELPMRLMYRAVSVVWRDPVHIITWFQQAVLPNVLIEEGPVF